MIKKKGKLEKVVANMAYETAKTSASYVCTWFFYQPKLPEAVKKLRKF